MLSQHTAELQQSHETLANAYNGRPEQNEEEKNLVWSFIATSRQ